jgi:hypothetical protein
MKTKKNTKSAETFPKITMKKLSELIIGFGLFLILIICLGLLFAKPDSEPVLGKNSPPILLAVFTVAVIRSSYFLKKIHNSISLNPNGAEDHLFEVKLKNMIIRFTKLFGYWGIGIGVISAIYALEFSNIVDTGDSVGMFIAIPFFILILFLGAIIAGSIGVCVAGIIGLAPLIFGKKDVNFTSNYLGVTALFDMICIMVVSVIISFGIWLTQLMIFLSKQNKSINNSH